MFIGFTQDNGHGYWRRTSVKHSSRGQTGMYFMHKLYSHACSLLPANTQFQDVLHHSNWGNWVRVGNRVRQGLKLMSQRQAEVTAKEKQR